MSNNTAATAGVATVNSVTTAPTYLELISRDEKTVQKENLKIKAQEAALNVSRDVLALNTEITLKRSSLETAQRAVPYSVAAEYKIAKELKELEERLAFANQIKETRFTDAAI